MIGKGTLPSTSGNIDGSAVPANHVRVVKAITLCNVNASSRWVNILLGGITVLYQYRVPGVGGENTITIPFMDQVLQAGDRITGQAQTAGSIHYYISGREVDVS